MQSVAAQVPFASKIFTQGGGRLDMPTFDPTVHFTGRLDMPTLDPTVHFSAIGLVPRAGQ